MQISLNPRFDFGIDWQKLFQSRNDLHFQGSFPIDSTTSGTNATTTSPGGTIFGKIAFGHVEDSDIVADIQFLKQVSNTKILANPRVMIVNKQESKINIGDRIPYVVTTSTGTGTNISVSEDIRFIDVGISLAVTPTINDDGFISMKIRPEISSKTRDLPTKSGNLIPVVNTTFIDTSIIVKDGMTIILGGLRRDVVAQDDKGVPYLMDVPWIGKAFKSRSDRLTRSEILLFITPRIVDGAKDVLDEAIAMKPSAVAEPEEVSAQRNIFAPMKMKPSHMEAPAPTMAVTPAAESGQKGVEAWKSRTGF